MSSWVILVRFSLERCSEPDEFLVLVEDVTLRIRKECPDFRWVSCHATLGEFDMVLIVECEDAVQVQRAAFIFRVHSVVNIQVMHALPWKEMLEKL
jgi:nitrate reductase gamma subunit